MRTPDLTPRQRVAFDRPFIGDGEISNDFVISEREGDKQVTTILCISCAAEIFDGWPAWTVSIGVATRQGPQRFKDNNLKMRALARAEKLIEGVGRADGQAVKVQSVMFCLKRPLTAEEFATLVAQGKLPQPPAFLVAKGLNIGGRLAALTQSIRTGIPVLTPEGPISPTDAERILLADPAKGAEWTQEQVREAARELADYIQGTAETVDEAIGKMSLGHRFQGMDAGDVEELVNEEGAYRCNICDWWCEVADLAGDDDGHDGGETTCKECAAEMRDLKIDDDETAEVPKADENDEEE